MVHLNITFPEDLKIELDREAKKSRTKRSTLIQHAVRYYLGVKHKKSQEELLKEGYAALAEESKMLMNDFKHADKDAWKHVD